MTLDELLQQAREKSDAAPRGPWTSVAVMEDNKPYRYLQNPDQAIGMINTWPKPSSEFIEFARTALPLLVKIVEEQNKALKFYFDGWDATTGDPDDSLLADQGVKAMNVSIRINNLIEKEMKP